MRHPLVLFAVAVWLFAWGRLLANTASKPSPAREFSFVDASGESTARPRCHGPVWVIDGTTWSVCTQDTGGESADYLTRFDLPAGIAHLERAAAPDVWRGISAAVAHPDGGLVFVGGDGRVRRWLADGQWEDLGLPGYKYHPCIAWVDGAIEVAYRAGDGRTAISRATGGTWTTQFVSQPPRLEGHYQRFEACEATGSGWRLTWLRLPERFSAGPVPVELWTMVGVDNTPKVSARLALDPDASPARVRLREGRAFLDDTLLERTGIVHRWITAPPLVRDEAGAWVEPILPPDAHLTSARHDYVFGGERAGPVLVFDLGRTFARVEGRWFKAFTRHEGRLIELDLDASAVKRVGPRVSSRFWLGIGFKMLPDDADGYWLMGALGEAYVHVDAQLERTDGYAFFGRWGRLFTEDRSKRNSDFYLHFAGVKMVAFSWVMLALPLLMLGFRRRLRPASAVYLVGVALGAWWWWQMSGTFW